MSLLLALLIPLTLSADELSCGFDLANGTVAGPPSCTFGKFNAKTVAECCDGCQANSQCQTFTFEPSEGRCFLKNCSTDRFFRAGAVSGLPPPPPPAPITPLNITASYGVVNNVSRWFKSWNIDASPNRQWETRDLSDPKLHFLASASEPGFLRFGGSGNDGLRYGVGQPCPTNGRCLNESHFVRFMDFSVAAGSRLVFGLNIGVRDSVGRWDPSDARPLIQFAITRNYTFYGFELGNEQDPGHSPQSEAEDFAVLQKLLVDLYPDAGLRPRIIGPDIHGFHESEASENVEKLNFMAEFAQNCSSLGVKLHGITHHEYIEVAEYSETPPPADLLNETAAIAKLVKTRLEVAAPDVEIWAGEIGPHNGRSPGCDHSSLRWSNFADSFWYLDAMASKAANGYKVFCRQDFVGIDYGLVDCLSQDPLPDYWSGVLWGRLMGENVISLSNNRTDDQVRTYAHCSAVDAVVGVGSLAKDLTILLINLDNRTQTDITLSLPGTSIPQGRLVKAKVYTLTGPKGTNSSEIALNGETLELIQSSSGGWALPEMKGNDAEFEVGSGGVVALPPLAPASIVFARLEGLGDAVGC